jgi:hypothetical protein
MDRDLARALRIMVAQLAVLTAAIHLVWGLPRLPAYASPEAISLYLNTNAVPDPRPYLFVAAGVAILLGIVAFWQGWVAPRVIYVLGIVQMAAFILGWALWHATGHGAPLLSSGGHVHGDTGTIHLLVDHLLELPLEAGSKLAEAMVIVFLAVLLRYDPALDRDEERETPATGDPATE